MEVWKFPYISSIQIKCIQMLHAITPLISQSQSILSDPKTNLVPLYEFSFIQEQNAPWNEEKNVILGENVQQKAPPAPLTGWGKKKSPPYSTRGVKNQPGYP